MPISLKHLFTSGKADGTDSTLVQPSNWNAEHVLQLAANRLVGRTTAGTGNAEEISVGAGLTFGSGSLSANITSVAGRTGAVVLTSADVSGVAPLASPTFTGTITGASMTLTGTLSGAAISGTTGAFTGAVSGASGAFTGAVSGSTVADAVGTLRPLVFGTAQATTSGTFKDFDTIPSWVNRVTVALTGVSLSGTAQILVQIGSGSVQTTGYEGGAFTPGGNYQTSTAGAQANAGLSAAYTVSGHIVFVRVSGNIWTWTVMTYSPTSIHGMGAGRVTLSGVLDRVRITSTNGTDTFDAGSVNIIYE